MAADMAQPLPPPPPFLWTQTLQDVSLTLPLAKTTKGKDVLVEFGKTHLKAGLRGQPWVVDVRHPCGPGQLLLSTLTRARSAGRTAQAGQGRRVLLEHWYARPCTLFPQLHPGLTSYLRVPAVQRTARTARSCASNYKRPMAWSGGAASLLATQRLTSPSSSRKTRS
jgi:hypothetical protein